MLTTREVIFLGLIDALREAYQEPEHPEQQLTNLFGFAQHVRDEHSVPDPMPRGWNLPAPATKHDVTRTLTDALQRMRSGDSLEGFVQWGIPHGDDPETEDAEYELMARYRVGNLDGQGGLFVFTGSQ